MNDPNPMRIVLLAGMAALLITQMWWLSLTGGQRDERLKKIAWTEGMDSATPGSIIQQYDWLTKHRWGRIQGMLMPLAIGIAIGLVEGAVRRRRDIHGGYLLSLWTVGLIAIGILPLAMFHYITIPIPVPFVPAMVALVCLVTFGAYGLSAGRPSIP